MTTQDLSRKLCEICGIKPISRCDYCPHNCLGSDVCKRGESVRYPDFTQPENFVKLEEFKSKIYNQVRALFGEKEEK